MASTSRTNVPLPTPPMDGLQDMAPGQFETAKQPGDKSLGVPTVVRSGVTSNVFAPDLADAVDASVPAWPAPIITTASSEAQD